jgi:hypothetical protein
VRPIYRLHRNSGGHTGCSLCASSEAAQNRRRSRAGTVLSTKKKDCSEWEVTVLRRACTAWDDPYSYARTVRERTSYENCTMRITGHMTGAHTE